MRGTPKGRSVDPKAREEVRALLKDAPRRRDLLIEHLHRIQDHYGHLSASHLVALADEMKLSMTEVYEVATFYHHFDVIKEGETAPPAITVRVCDSIACDIAGSRELLAKLPGILGKDVRVLHAPCIGRCETAPAAVVGQNPLPHATVEKIAGLVKTKAVKYAAPGHPHMEIVSPAYVDYAAYLAKDGYALARSCVEGARKREDVVAVMENSGLRGLGGAGFPAGRKWKSVAAEPAPRLMAINIDEGEPGTFKDRWYLERDPHRFIEGALVAAWAVGIDEIYVYLRDEYHGCRAILEREIAALQKNPPCKQPPIHLRRGAGAYICGEESAMIESIEGKRGMPRLRPPYVAQVGLFGRPTLEHTREEARDAPCAGGHHGEGADRGILRRDEGGPSVLRLSPGRRFGRDIARIDGRYPPRLRHAEPVRLFHRLGGGGDSLGQGPGDCGRAQPDQVLLRGVLRTVHALPRGHGKNA